MPRDVSGTYTLPTNDSSPAAPRNVIRSSDFNELTSDYATALTDSLSRSGDGAMLADLDMDGFSLLNEPTKMDKAQNLNDLADKGTAQDNIQVGAVFADVATATSATIPARNKRIRTQFYVTANRTGGSHYRRISFADLGSYPALSYFRSTDRFMPDGSTDNTNGGYWLLDEATPAVTMFGAVSNGGDAVAAIQAAADFAKLIGGRVYVPAGRYLVSADQRIENPGVEFFGDGWSSVLVKSGQNSMFRTLGTMPNKAAGFALASNATASTDQITLTAGAGASISTETLYVLVDESAIFTGNVGKKGEFVRVREVTGDTIKLWRYLKFSYATASTAKLVPVTLVEGVAYKNLRIEMDDTATVTSSNSFQEMFGLDIRWCKNPIVENVQIVDSLCAGIFFNGCVGGKVTGYRAERFGSNTTGTDDPASADGLPGFGYCIREESLNEALEVDDMEAIRCRNSYDTTAGYSALFNHGEPTGSVISNVVAIEPRGAGVGTHWPGYGISFNNITVIGGRRNGATIRARNTSINGITTINCRGPAVWLRGGDGGDPNLRGDDCTVRNVNASFTNLGADLYEAIDWREYGTVVDEGRRNTVEGVNAVSTGGGILSIGHNGIGRQGVYRNLTGRSVCQLAATTPDAVRVVNANTLANLVIDGLVVHSPDAKVRHLVSRETAATFDAVPINVTVNNVRGTGFTGSRVTSVTNTNGLRPDCGTYTPVQVSTNSNVTAVTHTVAQYSRVGDVVTVSGMAIINPTASGAFSVRMSVPIDTNFTAVNQMGGFARSAAGAVEAICLADSANECAFISGTATGTGAVNCHYQYSYLVA